MLQKVKAIWSIFFEVLCAFYKLSLKRFKYFLIFKNYMFFINECGAV